MSGRIVHKPREGVTGDPDFIIDVGTVTGFMVNHGRG